MCQDGAVIKALCADSCVFCRLVHAAEGRCATVSLSFAFRWSEGIVLVSRMKRMVLGISCGYKLL